MVAPFFDEIAELPFELQGKVLRILQEGEFERLATSKTMKVNVRVTAATNRNLEQLIKKNFGKIFLPSSIVSHRKSAIAWVEDIRYW